MIDIKKRLEAYAEKFSISPTTVCVRAGLDGKTYQRVCAGRITLRTAEKISVYMEANPFSGSSKDAKGKAQ